MLSGGVFCAHWVVYLESLGRENKYNVRIASKDVRSSRGPREFPNHRMISHHHEEKLCCVSSFHQRSRVYCKKGHGSNDISYYATF